MFALHVQARCLNMNFTYTLNWRHLALESLWQQLFFSFLVSGNGEEATVYTVKNESQIVPKTVPESSGKNDNKTITKTITFLTKNVLARTMFILIRFQYVPNHFLEKIEYISDSGSRARTIIYIYIYRNYMYIYNIHIYIYSIHA